jgi:single-stranded DNA-binding protein
MLGVNSVTLMGKVYNIKKMVSKNGKPITFFTLTTYSKQGEDKKDKALFHNCVSYGKLAEILGEHLTEKKELFVDGAIDYYDKDGITKTQIVVKESQFIGDKKNDNI